MLSRTGRGAVGFLQFLTYLARAWRVIRGTWTLRGGAPDRTAWQPAAGRNAGVGAFRTGQNSSVDDPACPTLSRVINKAKRRRRVIRIPVIG